MDKNLPEELSEVYFNYVVSLNYIYKDTLI